MEYTYNENRLTITANEKERAWLRDLVGPVGQYGETTRPYCHIEWDALEPLISNSELDWIRPEEIGALTAAPILGIRRGYMEVDHPDNPDNEVVNRTREEAAEVIEAWGYEPYALRSFVDDLIENGKTTFVSSF